MQFLLGANDKLALLIKQSDVQSLVINSYLCVVDDERKYHDLNVVTQ